VVEEVDFILEVANWRKYKKRGYTKEKTDTYLTI
jgi:hypothetical protein